MVAVEQGPFSQWRDADLARLVDEHPLAWIVPHADPSVSALMPVLLDVTADGKPISLTGHLPCAAPLAKALRSDPRATFLFTGPHRHIAPGWVGRRDWAPTWNFASARIMARVSLDPASTRSAIERLVARLEDISGWTVDELGTRYERLLERIVGFTAPIDEVLMRLKLGQDERDRDFARILDALGDDPLADWMREKRGVF